MTSKLCLVYNCPNDASFTRLGTQITNQHGVFCENHRPSPRSSKCNSSDDNDDKVDSNSITSDKTPCLPSNDGLRQIGLATNSSQSNASWYPLKIEHINGYGRYAGDPDVETIANKLGVLNSKRDLKITVQSPAFTPLPTYVRANVEMCQFKFIPSRNGRRGGDSKTHVQSRYIVFNQIKGRVYEGVLKAEMYRDNNNNSIFHQVNVTFVDEYKMPLGLFLITDTTELTKCIIPSTHHNTLTRFVQQRIKLWFEQNSVSKQTGKYIGKRKRNTSLTPISEYDDDDEVTSDTVNVKRAKPSQIQRPVFTNQGGRLEFVDDSIIVHPIQTTKIPAKLINQIKKDILNIFKPTIPRQLKSVLHTILTSTNER